MNENNRALCAIALAELRGSLPEQSYKQAHDWVHLYGEWGLAIECVVDWICDLDATITPAQYDAIVRAMTAMGWSESPRADHLREHFARRRS